jgi:hypothetical protein
MFGKLFSSETADFAIELANEFFARFPPAATNQGTSEKAFAKIVDDLCARAAVFHRDKRLGFYGKARFGTEFKLRLKELGYPDALVGELTHTLLIRMSAK